MSNFLQPAYLNQQASSSADALQGRYSLPNSTSATPNDFFALFQEDGQVSLEAASFNFVHMFALCPGVHCPPIKPIVNFKSLKEACILGRRRAQIQVKLTSANQRSAALQPDKHRIWNRQLFGTHSWLLLCIPGLNVTLRRFKSK